MPRANRRRWSSTPGLSAAGRIAGAVTMGAGGGVAGQLVVNTGKKGCAGTVAARAFTSASSPPPVPSSTAAIKEHLICVFMVIHRLFPANKPPYYQKSSRLSNAFDGRVIHRKFTIQAAVIAFFLLWEDIEHERVKTKVMQAGS